MFHFVVINSHFLTMDILLPILHIEFMTQTKKIIWSGVLWILTLRRNEMKRGFQSVQPLLIETMDCPQLWTCLIYDGRISVKVPLTIQYNERLCKEYSFHQFVNLTLDICSFCSFWIWCNISWEMDINVLEECNTGSHRDSFLGLPDPDNGELRCCETLLTVYQLTCGVISKDLNIDQHSDLTLGRLFRCYPVQ